MVQGVILEMVVMVIIKFNSIRGMWSSKLDMTMSFSLKDGEV